MILMNATIQKNLNAKIEKTINEMELIMSAKLTNDEAKDKEILQSKIFLLLKINIILYRQKIGKAFHQKDSNFELDEIDRKRENRFAIQIPVYWDN